MRVYLALVCACAVAAGAQVDRPPEDDSWSLSEIQKMLDRFSDTTMRTIEEQMRRKLDDYERSMEKLRSEPAPAAEPTAASTTYRLTFTIADVSAPISILATRGEYRVHALRQDDAAVTPDESAGFSYMLTCTGEIQDGEKEGHVLVSFRGESEVAATAGPANTATVSFAGSAELPLDKQQEIARNDELVVLLTVVVIEDEPDQPPR